MASRVAKTWHTSRSSSSALVGIWRSVGGSLASRVLQFRSYSDEVLDGRVSSGPEASSAAPRSGEFPSNVPKTRTFLAYRSVYDENEYPVRKCEVGKVKIPSAVLEFGCTRAAPRSCVSNHKPASRNVAQELNCDFPIQGFACATELPLASACGPGNIHLPNATATIRAIAILKNRQQQGIHSDSNTFVQVLKRCSEQKDLIAARQVHDCIIQSGMDQDPYVINTLLNVYFKCGRLEDACRLFDRFERKNIVTWNTMIGGHAKNGCGVEAYKLFLRMKMKGFKPTAITYLSILNPSASAGALEWVKEVHGHARRAGLESDLRVANALVHMYATSGSIEDAQLVFEKMEKRDVITWTIMIGAYAESGYGMEAYRLLLQMMREGFTPDAFTYASILNASASAGALEWVKEVHGHACRAGLESDLRVASALVHIYAKCGSIDDAQIVFEKMEKRDVITWNIMIRAYAESGYGVEAYRLFLQMEKEGLKPNASTYTSVLNASASVGPLEWVKEVHGHACRAGLESDLRVGSALVHMYAKSGSIDDARLLFNRMKNQDAVAFNIMIGGLAQLGRGQEALELFEKMNANGVEPDGMTFLAVLSACSHTGLVDDGRRLFSAMKQDYGIEATVVHYNCMVDVLGRAGHLEEAKLLIDNMPVEPDGVTWTAFLGACRMHLNVELGELAAKELIKLEPKRSSTYVLLSNIYAATGKWEKVSSLRKIMQERGVRKEPGRSWIEVDNKIHEFVAGDTSHPEAKAIYSVLQNLTEKIKSKGYIPDTKVVLQNINEEDKELALCSHSEKLAIAYGLLRVGCGKVIHVKKNLRICSDCHAATKLISEVTGREIIAQDANRFHHFKDGVCSCGDYW